MHDTRPGSASAPAIAAIAFDLRHRAESEAMSLRAESLTRRDIACPGPRGASDPSAAVIQKGPARRHGRRLRVAIAAHQLAVAQRTRRRSGGADRQRRSRGMEQ